MKAQAKHKTAIIIDDQAPAKNVDNGKQSCAMGQSPVFLQRIPIAPDQ
jgi:hypothetical protein